MTAGNISVSTPAPEERAAVPHAPDKLVEPKSDVNQKPRVKAVKPEPEADEHKRAEAESWFRRRGLTYAPTGTQGHRR